MAASSSSSSSSSRGRAWRSAFSALRRGSTDSCTLSSLLQQLPSLARSAHELPSQEVVQDISSLVEAVSHVLNDPELPSNYCKVCRLVADVSSSSQLDFGPVSSCQISRFLRDTIDRGPTAPDGYTAGSVQEAVNALAYFVNANGQHLSTAEANAVLLSLVPLMAYHDHARKDPRTRRASGVDCVFIAIANTFTRAGSLISQATWTTVVQAFRKVLDHAVQPLEDAVASRYYAAMLRSLHVVLSDAKGSLDDNVAGLVASLRMFFGYGLPGSRLKSASDNLVSSRLSVSKESNKGSSLYRPPHLRARLPDGEASGSTGDEKERRTIFSDSEQSDNDGFENDQFKSSKCRTNAILSIQAIARVDPKSLHAHWSLLLPTHNVLVPRLDQPTLLTTLLFDPILKTRVAAASAVSALLEGPARAFLQAAEYKDSGKTGSYTTLSSTLGQIIVELHKGLLHLVANELHNGVLLAVFKSLAILSSSSPFDRLPPRLHLDVVKTLHKKICELASSTDQVLMVSGLSCLTAALSASSGSSEVVNLLLERLPESSCDSIISSLVSFVRSSSSAAVRIEALQALKAAMHGHSSIASLYWKAISELVQEVIEQEISTRGLTQTRNGNPANVVDEKTVFHTLKLLDEALRAISGFKGADDMFDVPLSSPSPSLLPQPTRLLTSAHRPVQAMDELHLGTAAQYYWLETLKEILPLTLHHPAPSVRVAALTCFAGLTTAVYTDLTDSHQTYILSNVIDAAVKDGTPSVRSAACRALGVVVGCDDVVRRNERLQSAIATVQATISDPALAVRITSCWALGNICDALCKETLPVACDLESLNTLADIALRAAKDGDKVRANAVRALGNLAKFVDFSTPGNTTPCSWLDRMVQALVSCITTGNVKVQWNVCHALGNLFLNKSIRLSSMTWSSSVYSILLLLLRDSGNFKIRIHAVAALAVPSSRDDFGESYGDVLHGLIHALESMDSERAPNTSFKYISTLSEQLTSTSLRVLLFARPEDYVTLKDVLHKRATFLYHWLESLLKSGSLYGETSQMRLEAAGRVAEIVCGLFEYGREASLLDSFRKLKSSSQ